jgi:hypothetical protein
VVQELEQRFQQRFVPALQRGDDTLPVALPNWGGELGKVAARIQSLEQWRDVEGQVIVPQVQKLLRAADRLLPRDQQEDWQEWRSQYLTELNRLLQSLAQLGAERSWRQLEPLRRQLLTNTQSAATPMAQLALTSIARTPGVTSVLLGMRRPAYVSDALAVMQYLHLSESFESQQPV